MLSRTNPSIGLAHKSCKSSHLADPDSSDLKMEENTQQDIPSKDCEMMEEKVQCCEGYRTVYPMLKCGSVCKNPIQRGHYYYQAEKGR